MAIANPFSITYAGQGFGGVSSSYQLHGPYVIEKSFRSMRLVFDVLIVAASHSALKGLSETLEDTFQKRDQSFAISLGGSTWTYQFGTDALNVMASCQKTGNRETDRGYSRAYTCTVQADLPADDKNGLRDLELHVAYSPARQRTVTMRGEYTATEGTKASAAYRSNFDGEASTWLNSISSSAKWELVEEEYNPDRLDHTARFSRTYVELLANQSQGTLDVANIRDHRVVFTDTTAHPGDSKQDVKRLRRVVGTYDCSVEVGTGELKTVWTGTIKPHLKQLFSSNFDPSVFCIEDHNVSFDETRRRVSASIKFLFQPSGGEKVVEVAQSVAYREARNIDYTFPHKGNEYAAYADPGWAVRERVWTRTAIVVGTETPKQRIGATAQGGDAGLISGSIGGITGVDETNQAQVRSSGWNVVQNTSQVTQQWIGDPAETQLQLAILTETVVERYNEAVTGGTSSS